MGFYQVYSQNKGKRLEPDDENGLETKAVLARDLTLRFFGRAIQLYTPMYLANYCDNSCVYCGFNIKNNIERRKLSLDEVAAEARFISSTGLKHILILTGEDRSESPLEYIKDCIKVLKGYFSSISVEIYPLSEPEYASLVAAGVDGLTIYQEVYDEEIYSKVHPAGPKKDYLFRLDAPERGARAGMRSVNIGALLGLNDWKTEAFMLGLHAQYLQDKFPDVEIGVSLPRIRPQVSGFKPAYAVNDRDLAQIIIYLRLKLPRLSISLSTRESASLRENLIPLGITRISAGSSTLVGGHTLEGAPESAQFKIQDQRSIEEIKTMLYKLGYQPVLKDWMPI
ncbi:MAG: 2-iminoacetate synthase ThiH [Candidatus Omnitrophica bacterium]|nr:2-iminoacetate synthase ThiH [Candidatus Omnitrophota bacterium]